MTLWDFFCEGVDAIDGSLARAPAGIFFRRRAREGQLFLFLPFFFGAAFLEDDDFLAGLPLFLAGRPAFFLVELLFRGADFFAAFFLPVDFFAAFFLPVDFFALFFLAPFLAGTFAPSSRASDRPMAMACRGFFTFLPLLPDFSFPSFISCIARFTLLCDFLEYLAMGLVL